MTAHATVVAVGGRGVMIVGPSGSGKSDLALRLVDRGAVLVGDDYVALARDGGRLVARRVPTIAGRIEVRGVGLVETASIPAAAIALVVDLGLPPERLPEPALRETLGVRVPVVSLSPFEASAPLKVELALKRFGLPLERPLQ